MYRFIYINQIYHHFSLFSINYNGHINYILIIFDIASVNLSDLSVNIVKKKKITYLFRTIQLVKMSSYTCSKLKETSSSILPILSQRKYVK